MKVAVTGAWVTTLSAAPNAPAVWTGRGPSSVVTKFAGKTRWERA
mgnify:CR=1 FL=1